MHKDQACFGFLQKLDNESKNALAAVATPVYCQKKDYVFQAKRHNKNVYILTEGRIKLYRLSPQGQECIQWFCFPGEIFGISEYNYKQDSELYAQAITASSLWSISKAEFNELMLLNPAMALVIIDQLSSRVRTMGDMLLHITCGNAETRLANLLQRLSSMYGKPVDNNLYIDMHLTHQEIADMIGVCRQTVSSTMSKLKRMNIISCDRQGIAIRNSASLDRIMEMEKNCDDIEYTV